tara:strand:- start:111 stop:389 length:279 start_codon:yes stop_codon:yes gene_type:complete
MKTYTDFNEGILDMLTKKGREKRKGEKSEKQAKEKTEKSKQSEIKRMDNLDMKSAGRGYFSPEDKAELAKLKTKHADLIKKRQEKHRSSGPR